MTLKVDAIRECLEGVIPATIATCAADGTPNVAYLSQVQFVDGDHVALSYQFFNKTRQNVLANPRATVIVTQPETGARYLLAIQYLRTETAGPIFESMKAKLAGIASHTGMSGIFRLLGSDIYRVLDIERVPAENLRPAPERRNLLSPLRLASQRISACADLEGLFNETLNVLESEFDIRHAMILMLDRPAAKLYTVASRGYQRSGVGSEISLGEGVIGVAAREQAPIRIGHMTSEYGYSRAMRDEAKRSGMGGALETEIPPPGLEESRSQLAVPILAIQRLLGVLYVESPQDLRFQYDDEDALVALAGQVGVAMHVMQSMAETSEESSAVRATPARPKGKALTVRHYAENDSVFLNDDYLIKGVAGAIFWTLLRDYADTGRTEFSNRELRVDPRIRLPDIADNLEARLILLARRLTDREAPVRIEKTGRGRFNLCVAGKVQLKDFPSGASRMH
jgi:adenylate cyclase